MKNRIFLALLTLLTLAWGCRNNELERTHVPLVWGMRFDNAAAETEINANLAYLRDHKIRELMLELPLVADSTGLPMVPDLPYASIKGLLLNYKVGLHLTFAPTSTKELYPGDSMMVTPEAWFAALRKEIDEVINTLQPCPIDRVIVGSRLGIVTIYGDLWQSTFDSLRQGREILFSYGSTLEDLSEFSHLRASDEFALDYTPMAGKELKAESREYHHAIERITDSLHMPLFIFRANIIGEDPTIQFKNRLRFWKPSTRHRGMAINTLYPKIPLRDSTSYYGLADNPDFWEYVQEYLDQE